MRSGGRGRENVPERVLSLVLAVLMTSGAVLALVPFIGPTIIAPPTAGTLDVTFHDIAPDTHTFPGDENVTMIWLEMTASGGDVQVNSLNFTLGGNFSAGEVSSVALLDDFSNCELANITNPKGSFTLPTAGNLNECTPPLGGYIILQSQTRYILVFVSVSPTAAEGNTTSINLDAMNTDGSVVGDSGASSTIEILHIFFSDDMESGQGGWTMSGGDDGGQFPNGLWHRSSGEFTCKNNILGKKFYHSYNSSWWYGHRYEDPYFPGEYICAYYTWDPSDYLLPTRNWGELRTPDVDAMKGQSLYLSFRHMLFGEPDTPVIKPDNGHLRLYDGSWHNVTPYTDGYDSTDNSWWKEKVNLSAYAGSQVKLEFGFDTVDEENNGWMGWFVDDVTIYGKMVKHALAVNNNDVPPLLTLPEDGSPVMCSIAAQVNNIGASDEFDIVVNLTVNGTTVNQTMIGVLNSGTNTLVSLGWLVKAEGVYEVCIEATAASGASSRGCRIVTVIILHITNVAVLRSYGTRSMGVIDTWNHLNGNWGDYGSTRVEIDYTSLDVDPITYDAINATGAEVLLLSSSGHYGLPPPGDMELNDNETAAIEKYVNEGHGLVTTGTAFDFRIPNNNDLADLVGIKDQAYYQDEVYDMQVDPACARESPCLQRRLDFVTSEPQRHHDPR
jgi:hypothetical protein